MQRPIVSLLAIAFLCSDVSAQNDHRNAKRKPRDHTVRVLVLNFDPIVDQRTKKRLHEECRWQDPHDLAKGYATDVQAASRDLIHFKIVEWQDLDEFPLKADGFTYTMDQYLRCYRANKDWHKPDGADYPRLIAGHNLIKRVEKGEIDEVWWFGPPYTGFAESAMAGWGAFYINGGVYGADQVPCRRAFAIMGFNYERGVAEMLHDLCHRTESTMSRVFGGWQANRLDSDWARFAANFKQSGGVAGVGNCHFPPNAEADYDYGNKRLVDSFADDWLDYPKLKGVKQQLNCEAWGGPDFQRNYLKWWFARLPHAAGVNRKNGRLNNWWEYVFNFNVYDDHGRPAPAFRNKGLDRYHGDEIGRQKQALSKAKKKPQDTAVRRHPADDHPLDEAAQAEQRAEVKFQIARELADDGKVAEARARLRDILKTWPRTMAAAKAERLLRKLSE